MRRGPLEGRRLRKELNENKEEKTRDKARKPLGARDGGIEGKDSQEEKNEEFRDKTKAHGNHLGVEGLRRKSKESKKIKGMTQEKENKGLDKGT